MTNISLLYGQFTDNELIEKIKNGHEYCFEILVRRYNQPLYRIGRMYGIAQDDLPELICNAHITVFNAIHAFDMTRTNYRIWLTEIMIQKCRLKLHSERQRGIDKTLDDPSGIAVRTVGHYNTYRLVSSSGIANKLEHNIDKLPVSIRSTFVLHEIEGYTVADTARLLHLPESHIRTNINNAKSLLRKTIKNWHYHTGVYTCSMDYNEYIISRLMPHIVSGYNAQAIMVPR